MNKKKQFSQILNDDSSEDAQIVKKQTKKVQDSDDDIIQVKNKQNKKKQQIQEESSEEVIVKKPSKKQQIQEESSEEVVVKKPAAKKQQQIQEESSEEVVVKKPAAKKQQKQQIQEESSEEVVVKKPAAKKQQQIQEESSEEVVVKKPAAKKQQKQQIQEESSEEVVVKKPAAKKQQQIQEESSEEVVVKKPSAKKQQIQEESSEEVVVKKPVAQKKQDEEVVEKQQKTEQENQLFEVIIKNLSFKTTEDELGQFFEDQCENCEAVRIPQGDRGSKGMAFVSFSNKESMDKAINLSGSNFQSRELRIEQTNKSKFGDQNKLKTSNHFQFEIIVRNLCFDTTQDQIGQYFEDNCGGCESVNLLTGDRGSKGICFVRFENEQYLQKAIQLNGSELDGFRLNIEKTQAKENRQSNSQIPEDATTIFVGNLSYNTNEETIRDFFNNIGTITDVRIAKNENGESRGFGHVEFSTNEEVKKAIQKAGSKIDGRNIKVDVAAPRAQKTGGNQNRQRSMNNFDNSAKKANIAEFKGQVKKLC